MMRRVSRATLLALADILGLGLYAVGLVSPLTPSEGRPSVQELAVFAGLPFAAWATSALMARHGIIKITCVAVAISIFALTAYLFYVQRPG